MVVVWEGVWKIVGFLLIVVVCVGGIFLLRNYFFGGMCNCKLKFDGKIVIVIGVNIGIGWEIVFDLVWKGVCVIMVCRNFEKVYVVVEEIKKIIGNEKVIVKELDFVLLKFVRNFVEEVY